MEAIFLIAGLVIVPWFMGVVYIFKLIAGSNKEKYLASQLLEYSEKEQNHTKKSAYLTVASYLTDGNSEPGPETKQETVLPYVSDTTDNYRRWNESTQPYYEDKSSNQKTTADQFKKLENINILLYIGAFLVVMAAGIFVGFNYQSLSGNFKTTFLTIFALTFYLTGLVLYLKSEKIKEAGLTFLTIGLILFPLVGLAFFKFTNFGHGNIVWFITSLATIFLYILSLILVKKTYLAYFVTFVSLSLFESTISLFNVPIYYFAWGMAFASIIFLLISKVSQKEEDLSGSFAMTANIFLPISLVLSIFTVEKSWMVVAVNLLLASLFYFISNLLAIKQDLKEGFFTAALILFPLGISLVLFEKHISSTNSAFILGAIALVYLIGYELIKSKLHDLRPSTILTLSGLIPVFLCFLFVFEAKSLIFALLYVLLINTYCFYRAKQSVNLVFSCIAFLLIPKIILVYQNNNSIEVLSLIYLILGLILFGFRYFASKLGQKATLIFFTFYLLSLFVSVVVLFGSQNHSAAILLLLANALFVYFLSYIEDQSVFEVFTVILIYITGIRFGLYLDLSYVDFIWIFILSGLALFATGMIPGRKSKILSYGGLAGPFFGAVYGVGENSLLPIFSLTIAGAMSMAKSFEEKNTIAKYISAGIFVVALNWILKYNNVMQAQFYTVSWAIFFAIIAYLRSKQGDKHGRDMTATVGLAFLTIPTLFQSFFTDNGPIYALVLGLESIILIIAGIGINYKLILRWGVTLLVIDVLYQSRVFIAAVPKWMIIGIIGIAILVGATYALSKRSKED